MKRIYWIFILCALLGAAGYWWFESWYGWLTSMGALALRVGPLFVWRVALRIIRRWLLRTLFVFFPPFIKRPVRAFGRYVAAHLVGVLDKIRATWRSSWVVRAAVILPLITTSCVLAYDAEGFMEFLYLFPIPFLFTAMFPEGFWMLVLGYFMQLLAAHGLETVVEKFTTLLPEDLIDGYHSKKRNLQRVLVETSRPLRMRATRWMRRARRKLRGKSTGKFRELGSR